MAMASHFIASSSPTFTHSLQSPYKSLKPNSSPCLSIPGSFRFSPYIGLKHLGISISPRSSNLEKKRRGKGMVVHASLFGVGAPEALVIGVVALLVFGPKGLAEVARNLGKTLRAFQPTIRELQDVSREFKSTLEREIGLDEPNMYNPNRMNPPPPSVGTASNPNDAPSPKAYTTEDYLKITEEQLKASSPSGSQVEDQSQAQEQQKPTPIQTPIGETQPEGTERETTAAAPPRQD